MKGKFKHYILFVSALMASVVFSANADPGVDQTRAIVQLKGEPLATYVKTKPPQGKKIDFDNTAVKSYRAELSALRNDFKQWLQANAPKAKITGNYDIALNAVSVELNGTSLAKLTSAPQVQYAQYQHLYYPTQDDPDLSLIDAPQGWAAQGGDGSTAGENRKIAIIDAGIDQTHPCFSDVGYPPQVQLGDTQFTNNKVIVAKVFINGKPNTFTPEAVQDHGTHVAGIAACNFNTGNVSVSGINIGPFVPDSVKAIIDHTISGVAPRALLGNYNVFPGNNLTARDENILNALDAAYVDGFEIANMSLGETQGGVQDLLVKAVDNFDQANMVVTVSAGNSGPGHFTVESPGSAARALTGGASSVGHLVGAGVTAGSDNTVRPAMVGFFNIVPSDLTAPLSEVTEGAISPVTGIGLACESLTEGSLNGKIALISRGTPPGFPGICEFATKIQNAQDAGAVAVLMVNNLPGLPVVMGPGGAGLTPSVPAYMVSYNDGIALRIQNNQSTTITRAISYFVNQDNDDFMANFSSQGPTQVDFRVKPDVVAPGLSVLNAIPQDFCTEDNQPCFLFLNGTSMSAPHLAGTAAVVKQQHPTWSSAQIRSAIVNTAEQDVLKKPFFDPVPGAIALETDVNIIGTGRLNVLNAVSAVVALDPVSISFGSVPAGKGTTATFNVTLSNLGTAGNFSVEVIDTVGTGVSYTASISPTSLGVNGTATVIVTMTSIKGAAKGDHQAQLVVNKNGSPVAHAVIYTFIK